CAGKLRHKWISTRREQDVRRRIAIALLVRDLAWADEARALRDDVDCTARQIAGVNAVQALDVGVAAALQLPPVVPHGGRVDVETVVAGMGDRMSELGRVPYDFLRHAADVDAGAAEPRRLEQHDGRAMVRGPLGGREAAAAAA